MSQFRSSELNFEQAFKEVNQDNRHNLEDADASSLIGEVRQADAELEDGWREDGAGLSEPEPQGFLAGLWGLLRGVNFSNKPASESRSARGDDD